MDETRLEKAIRALSKLAATGAANGLLKTQVQGFRDQLEMLKAMKNDCTKTVVTKSGKKIWKLPEEDAKVLLELYGELSTQITQIYITIMCA